jgi:hypothetical protein
MVELEKLRCIVRAGRDIENEYNELIRRAREAERRGGLREGRSFRPLLDEVSHRQRENKKLLEQAVITAIAELVRIPDTMRENFRRQLHYPILYRAERDSRGSENFYLQFKDDRAFIKAAEKVRAAKEAIDGLSKKQRRVIFVLMHSEMSNRMLFEGPGHREFSRLVIGEPEKAELALRRLAMRKPDEALDNHTLFYRTIDRSAEIFLPVMVEAFTKATGKNPNRAGRKGAVHQWAFRNFVLSLRETVQENGGRLPFYENEPNGGAKFNAAMDIVKIYLTDFVPNVLPVKSIASDWRSRSKQTKNT